MAGKKRSAGQRRAKPPVRRPSKKGAYGSGCMNRECKLRKGGCTGFEGCPGFKGKEV